MLDPISRSAIVAMSALCVAGAVALAPVRVRSSIEDVQLHPKTVSVRSSSDAVTLERIRRDPFAEPTASSVPAQTAASAPAVTAPAPLLTRETVMSLPSNLTNDTIPAIPGTVTQPTAGDPLVTAIVTGAHPYAMVENGANHEIVGVGDHIGGIAIVSIDLGGIRLHNGRYLTVDPAGRQ